MSVSAALAALEEEGLVVRNPGRGTRVLPVSERLSKPLVGVVFGHPQQHRPELSGSFATLHGVLTSLARLHCRYEVVSIVGPLSVRARELFTRFGALIFADGLCLPEEAIAAELERRPIPVTVAKLEKDYALANISATWVDHRESTLQAVRVLVNMGHRRIGFVTRQPDYAFYGRALDGYLSGLREAGLPVDESLIAEAENTDALSGYFAGKRLLNGPSGRPTAIVAGRDTLAEGVCRAIEEAGLYVGHHVSVIGFDDVTWPQAEPILTTFQEPCYEMGVVAAQMLVERIVDNALPPERRKFETPFVLRRTAGPPLPDAWSPHPQASKAVAGHGMARVAGEREGPTDSRAPDAST